MTLSIIDKLSDLVPNAGCVFDSLQPILQSCEVPEQTHLRTEISVKLSLCEFAAAGIDFPPICLNRNLISECTKELESKATWWTTFSGNYRHISVICKEYQPQFEANKFVRVFKNASNLFNTYQTEMELVLNEMQLKKTTVEHEWQLISSKLSLDLQFASNQLKILQTELQNVVQNSSENLIELNTLSLNAIEYLNSASNQISESNRISLEMSNIADSFDIKMNQIVAKNNQTAHQLNLAASNAENVLIRSGRVLERYGFIVSFIAKIVLYGLKFSLPCAFLVVGIVVFMWFRGKVEDYTFC